MFIGADIVGISTRSSQVDFNRTIASPAAAETKKPSTGLDTLKRYAILASGMLPFSSRGLPANLLKVPIRLFQSLGKGISEMVAKGSVRD